MMRNMRVSLLLIGLSFSTVQAFAEYYELRIYHIADTEDELRMETYLQDALIPALHRAGIATIGVFKPAETDTINTNRIYVLIPHASLTDFEKTNTALIADARYTANAKNYLEAAYNNPPYVRMETIILRAFRLATKLQVPKLKAPKEERIYELRSYESPTETLYRKKVQMFNEGGEIGIFAKLHFNPVFYSEVLSGSHMPNLMYMTSFENRADRDAHWKAFTDAPEWKSLSSMEEYKNTVSKADVLLLHGTEYSDL
jgi:NIPSNAP